jgi:hypothetical protein
VAIYSNYTTWDAYNNEYWPADYLIDPRGQMRVYDYGEGGYSAADKTPTQPLTQESYLGYGEEQYAADDYRGPSTVPNDSFAFNGIWTDHSEEEAGAKAEITLNFTGDDVYLVMGGGGTVQVSLDGQHLSALEVEGVPRLYTLFSGESLVTGELEIDFAPGVQAYDFTFG